MAIIWLQTSKNHNKMRILFLILLMPFLVFLTLLLYFFWVSEQDILKNTVYTLIWCVPILLLWLLVAINIQKSIIFWFTGAEELNRKENKRVFNIVENLAISKWLPTPKIGIIQDSSINAFATGWTAKNSWIVFSKWAIDTLDDSELRAVAWHELTHILNDDVKVMVITNVFIWIIWTVGYILMRTGTRGSWKKWWNALPLLWFLLYFLSILILPFINLAISRKKEYLADAWSVELTKDRDAMIGALRKIEKDSVIEKLSKNSSTTKAMFIWDPTISGNVNKKKDGIFRTFNSFFSTHPSIDSRIEMLRKY